MSSVSIRSAEDSSASIASSGGGGDGGLGRTLVLALGTFAVGTDAFVLAGFLPDVAASLHTSTASAGQAVTVFAAAYAVASPVVATLTARFPRRLLLVAALIVLAAANAASALAPNLPLLLAARVLAAAGAAGYTPTAGAVTAALVRPEMRGRALAVVVGGLTVATALGVPLGDAAGAVMGWRAALGLVAALCLLTAIAAAVLMPTLPGSAPVPLAARLAALRRPGVASVLPLTVLGMAAAYTVYAYAIPALHALGIADGATAWILAAYGAGAILGNLAAGIAADRLGPTRVLVVGYALMAMTLATFAVLAVAKVHAPALVAVLAITWGASTWCQTPPQQHRLFSAAPSEAPLLMALNASAIYVGIGIGTAAGGLLVASGAAWMFTIAAIVACLALGWLAATATATGHKATRRWSTLAR
ncbi:major facilitator superfamily MFS_1 [Catenulispora acidiphila DSM 44928]|uniref:Major facilitator superfamily MFS_1 n=1 Tax=Catenulispora acidiphila (strain DSM 44928 / JCM 14897 / NBRC 102108 / NRRL B-24433 / ID139908) TaxID=479433 RepID=C7Q1E1_CATAD|nr:MFS transporter [Catenulispora acidiphila]ACU73670.1 major facilitator superfamily MFS_1 [Catenulispora acidiphila DSM 44928]